MLSVQMVEINVSICRWPL